MINRVLIDWGGHQIDKIKARASSKAPTRIGGLDTINIMSTSEFGITGPPDHRMFVDNEATDSQHVTDTILYL